MKVYNDDEEASLPQEWIEASEALPPIGREVIVERQDGKVTALTRFIPHEGATRFYWDNHYPGTGNYHVDTAVARWMPMPKPNGGGREAELLTENNRLRAECEALRERLAVSERQNEYANEAAKLEDSLVDVSNDLAMFRTAVRDALEALRAGIYTLTYERRHRTPYEALLEVMDLTDAMRARLELGKGEGRLNRL